MNTHAQKERDHRLPASAYINDPYLQQIFRDMEGAEKDPHYVPISKRPIELPSWVQGIITFFSRIG